MEKMENLSNSSCQYVAFGDNGNGCVSSDLPCMIMPLMTQQASTSAANPPPDTESHNNNNNSNNNRTMGEGHRVMVTSALNLPCSSSHPLFPPTEQQVDDNCYFMDNSCHIKAKIMAHPHYPRLLAAYITCQKVGAPPEVVSQLEEICASEQATSHSTSMSCIGEDPALDQFMEAYCEMLTKYEHELTKPFKEAMLFLSKIECQFKSLSVRSFESASCEALERNGSSEEEVDVSENCVDPLAEDRELKGQLLRKYSGYLGSLKQEFLKKRKKGKLPKEARQQLLDWWGRHYKWPYPSESQKQALAESTGLDQKQINNWFINQRKRHWKPSEEMQFVVMDASQHPHHYYMDDNLVGHHHFPMDYTSPLL